MVLRTSDGGVNVHTLRSCKDDGREAARPRRVLGGGQHPPGEATGPLWWTPLQTWAVRRNSNGFGGLSIHSRESNAAGYPVDGGERGVEGILDYALEGA
jgi:hypothetical protein